MRIGPRGRRLWCRGQASPTRRRGYVLQIWERRLHGWPHYMHPMRRVYRQLCEHGRTAASVIHRNDAVTNRHGIFRASVVPFVEEALGLMASTSRWSLLALMCRP